jgi:hypothetical protein
MSETSAFRAAHPRVRTWRVFTEDDASRLAGRVPPEHLALLATDGWASYDDGALWLVDPDELGPITSHWAEGTPLFRTAFGTLFIWDGAVVWRADVHYGLVGVVAIDASFLYSDVLVRPKSVKAFLDPKAVRRATQEAGSLEPDEMYLWVPALALGGDPETSSLARGGMREALATLAQSTRVLRR